MYFGLTERVRQFDGRSYAGRAVSKRKSAKNRGLIAQTAKGQHSQTDFTGLTIYSYSCRDDPGTPATAGTATPARDCGRGVTRVALGKIRRDLFDFDKLHAVEALHVAVEASCIFNICGSPDIAGWMVGGNAAKS
ncbi:hypothetical protein [Mesorhizobium sp. M2C.T.Ca.TU.002.02.1.1]|uniref:hypothetical protein n=1 Tax=Mesorhizobium sp. M2C.T.Ca.TU.002.02.1.1 TaxID=2496788 RepID=UPI0013E35925|nr:hypothetical protein [Mesorhizobium sp. M2C.T.Ca.TU.002.02.1.1]